MSTKLLDSQTPQVCGERNGEHVPRGTQVFYQHSEVQPGKSARVKRRCRLQVFATEAQTLQQVRKKNNTSRPNCNDEYNNKNDDDNDDYYKAQMTHQVDRNNSSISNDDVMIVTMMLMVKCAYSLILLYFG